MILPVGSTIKRMVVQVDDTASHPDGYLNIQLVRANNIQSHSTVLRSVDTSSIASSSIDDFKQLVSNPVNHSVLQGWIYWVLITPNDYSVISNGDIAISKIKIIYEP